MCFFHQQLTSLLIMWQVRLAQHHILIQIRSWAKFHKPSDKWDFHMRQGHIFQSPAMIPGGLWQYLRALKKFLELLGSVCIFPCNCFAKEHLHFCVIHAGGMGPSSAITKLSPDAHLNFLWLLTPWRKAGSGSAPGHRLCFCHHLNIVPKESRGPCLFWKMQMMQPLNHFNALT